VKLRTALGRLAAPRIARAQKKPLAKVRYNEVVRSILYAPAYVAIAKGFFEEVPLDDFQFTPTRPGE